MSKHKNFDVQSPDGFSIHHSDVYATKAEAQAALKKWVKGYERQGYYSSNRGRIGLDELADHCKIVEVDF